MELQVNLEKTVKITFLQGKKGTNKVHPNLFRAFQQKMYDSCFEDQGAAWKVNITSVVVMNKERTCARYI